VSTLDFPKTTARVWTLPNGLELIVKEDHAAPVVSLQAWCRSGSIHEGEWLGAGMSHFLEHMLFKGTGRRDANEIAQTVQAAGGYINAYTSFDRTVYWIDSPTDGYETCLEVLCDVVADSKLPEDEFQKEAEVIRREFAMGDDNPDQVLSKMMFHNAFARHPCRHPVIGHIALFNQLSRDDLADYYHRHYSPDNLFLVITGDVEAERVRGLVEQHLGGIPRRRHPHPVIPEEPRQLGRREVRELFPTELSRTEYAWHIPGLDHPDMPALDLLASIAGGGKSSRFYREVRENRGLAHSISAYSYTPAQTGLFIASIDTEPEKRDEAEAAALECLDAIAREGVTDEEVKKVTNQALKSQFSTLVTMRGQASDLGSNWNLTRNLDFTRDYVRAIQSVTTAEIQKVARKYLVDDSLTIVSLDPPNPEAAEKARTRTTRSDDIQKIEFDNGLTTLLLADKRVPLVSLYANFRGGMLAATPNTAGICRLMTRLLTKDTRNRSAEEVAELMESVGGSLSSTDGRNTLAVTAGVFPTDLELALDLIGDSLLEPTFIENTLEREKEFQIAGIKAENDRPFSVAMLELRRAVFGESHPYGLRTAGTTDTVPTFEGNALESLRSRMVCGNNGVIAVYGDIDPNRAEDLVRARFEHSLEPGERAFSGDPHPLPAHEPKEIEIVHDKEQAILLVGFRTGGVFDADRAALDLLDEACSDMASRVFIRIREELGLAYSVGATRLAGLDTGLFVFYAATSPENLHLVQTELIDEIDLLAARGLDTEELERARASFLGSEVMQLQSASSLASITAVDELVGLGFDHYRGTPDKIRALTAEQIQETAARHFAPERRVVVRLTNPGA